MWTEGFSLSRVTPLSPFPGSIQSQSRPPMTAISAAVMQLEPAQELCSVRFSRESFFRVDPEPEYPANDSDQCGCA